MKKRLKIVGVMGSGRERHEDHCRPLGALLARLGVHLLTGGGAGVMEAVAQGFSAAEPRAGVVIGILPGEIEGDCCVAPAGYPNRHVEIPIRTHLPGRGVEGAAMHSRNWINIASSDALVFLPGGAGTASEAMLARRLGKPAIGLGGGGKKEGLPQAATIEEVEIFLRAVLEPGG